MCRAAVLPNTSPVLVLNGVAIALGMRTKAHGTAMVGRDVELYRCNERGEAMYAYERLIGDAMRGDGTLFAREDTIEAAWHIVGPVLGTASQVLEYDAGSWGPAAADTMTACVCGWSAPSKGPSA